ncbi:hypothetical protein [Collinsella tanakaei]|uniref:hypothetical protein n=1 Tax=Collinsella tanakaei TaxID=626935 RepID=UPI0025A33BA9|nr:hypothetical protein [Collinsella tanakaei]MDM8300988.1 hypothetical protein [Collinsella tanakaei]
MTVTVDKRDIEDTHDLVALLLDGGNAVGKRAGRLRDLVHLEAGAHTHQVSDGLAAARDIDGTVDAAVFVHEGQPRAFGPGIDDAHGKGAGKGLIARQILNVDRQGDGTRAVDLEAIPLRIRLGDGGIRGEVLDITDVEEVVRAVLTRHQVARLDNLEVGRKVLHVDDLPVGRRQELDVRNGLVVIDLVEHGIIARDVLHGNMNLDGLIAALRMEGDGGLAALHAVQRGKRAVGQIGLDAIPRLLHIRHVDLQA